MGNPGLSDASQSDETFQRLLLELSRAAFQSTDPSQLIRSFCKLTRAFFHASGAYFWSRSPDGELVGAEADTVTHPSPWMQFRSAAPSSSIISRRPVIPG